MDILTPPKPLYWAAVAFIGGIFTADYLITPLPVHILPVLIFLGALLTILYLLKRWRLLRTSIILTMCFVGGMYRMDLAQRLPDNHLSRLHSVNISVYAEGIVTEDPVIYQAQPSPLYEDSRPEKPYGNFVLGVQLIARDGVTSTVSGLVRVNFTGSAGHIKYGDRIGLTGLMYTPAGPTNPGEFDYRQYLARQGISRILKCSDASRIQVLARGQGNPALGLVYGIRRAVSGKIDRMFSAQRVPFFDGQSLANTASLIKTLLLGDRSSFPQDIQDKFMRTGTIHYLSVSGLHLAIVVAICFMVLWWIGVTGQLRIVITLIAAVGYTALTGLYTPIIRSLVMVFCFLGADLFNRKPNSLNSLSLAALIITLFNPLEVFNIGAQLSFISVLFIIVLSPRMLRILLGRPVPEEALVYILPQTFLQKAVRTVKKDLMASVAVSMSVWGGIILLTLYYFHIITPVAFLSNIVLSGLIFVLMLLGFMTLPFILVGEIVTVLVAHSLCWLINSLVELMAQIPLAYIYLPDIPLWFVKVFYGLFFASLLLVGKNRGVRYLSLGAKAAIMMMLGLTALWIAWSGLSGRSPFYRAPDAVTLTMLDVRQGSAFVLETTDGRVVVFDAGTFGNRDIGKGIIAPYFWQRGITRIDNLVLSHPHPDHISGVISLADRFTIKELFTSRYFSEYEAGRRLLAMTGLTAKIVRPGNIIPIGDNFNAEVLGPPDGMAYHKSYYNDTSLVLRLGNGTLLCNDIEKKGIGRLMSNPLSLTGIAVMQLPHHGFSSSFMPEFINSVKPRYALLNSDGKRLAEGLLELCRNNGIRVLSSYECGAVTLSFRANGVEIKPYRDDIENNGKE